MLWDVQRYPEFLTDVIDTVVEPGGDAHSQIVTFEVRVFRTRKFRLHLAGDGHAALQWTLVDGTHLRQNEGEWLIEELAPGLLRLHYRLCIDIDVAVPAAIARRMIDFNLPTALRQVKARVEILAAAP